MTNLTVSSLIVHSNGDLFVGTGEYLQGFAGDGVFRSTNNGDSWTQVSPNLTNIIVPALAVGFNDDIFAATIGKGVFRSTDNGESWMQTGLADKEMASLAIDSNGHVLAGGNALASLSY